MTKNQSMHRPWQEVFLAALRDGQSATQAAKAANINRSTPYNHRKSDPAFARAWDEAVPNARFSRTKPSQKRRKGPWCATFLETLAETSNIKLAARRADISVQTAYALRRNDSGFAAQWLDALLEGYLHLEMEVLAYLRDPDPKRKLDVAAILRLLAAHRETPARKRAISGDESEQAVLESIDKFLEDMRRRRRANAVILNKAKDKNGTDQSG